MEPYQDGASIWRPRFLTGKNYSHLKVRMWYFLIMQSKKGWNAFEYGWSLSKVLDRECWPTNVIKPKLEWDRGENKASEKNARAMYSIVDPLFCPTSTCSITCPFDTLQ